MGTDGGEQRGSADFVARELPARCAGGSAAAQLADAARAVDEAFLQTRPDDPSGCAGPPSAVIPAFCFCWREGTPPQRGESSQQPNSECELPPA